MCRSVKFRARWVFPIESPPIENGVVELEEGNITAVHGADTDAVDLGNVALLPALINCHAHLEFSSLAQPFSNANSFTSWIKTLLKYRREREIPIEESFSSGLTESWRCGVSLVGEIATTDWPLDLARKSPVELLLFRECLGHTSEQRGIEREIARRHLEQSCTSSGVCFGLAPHAPYSVHPDLLRDLIDLAVEFDAPVSMHLAETKAEIELLRYRRGDIADMLREFGIWDRDLFDGTRTILDDLHQLARAKKALVIHGNYLSDEEIRMLSSNPRFSVIYCPRTHHYFGHEPHPWEKMASLGINVALGTDGRCSNPDLVLWNELLFVKSCFPRLHPEELLRLVTLNAARALGYEAVLGSLKPGKRGDLIKVPLGCAPQSGDPYQLLLNAGRPPQPVSERTLAF